MAYVWFVLIVASLAAVGLTSAIRPAYAILVAVVAVIFLIGFGIITSYWFGVARRFRKHLGARWKNAETVSYAISRAEAVNFQIALEKIHAATPMAPKVFGLHVFSAGVYQSDGSLGEDLDVVDPGIMQQLTGNPWPVPLTYVSLPSGLGKKKRFGVNAVYMVQLGDGSQLPFVALVRNMKLVVMAESAGIAEEALEYIQSEARANSVYRHQTVSLELTNLDNSAEYDIVFHALPTVRRDAIILPEPTMTMIERNVLGILRHAETLRAAGQGTRHGVLFYGPPGTGKSLAVKYLATVVKEVTVLLLTSKQLRLVRESCRLARLLAPTLVILEDIDLIATDREQSQNTLLLHDLMDEMDGLGPRSDVIFILTTNRPEVLERALTARPGRIDQAVYFPLPDAECRRRLLQSFAKTLLLPDVLWDTLIDRTTGASPAFIEEMVKRASLFAAERGESSLPLRVTMEDFQAALRDLVEMGGPLTQALLGYGRRNDEKTDRA